MWNSQWGQKTNFASPTELSFKLSHVQFPILRLIGSKEPFLNVRDAIFMRRWVIIVHLSFFTRLFCSLVGRGPKTHAMQRRRKTVKYLNINIIITLCGINWNNIVWSWTRFNEISRHVYSDLSSSVLDLNLCAKNGIKELNCTLSRQKLWEEFRFLHLMYLDWETPCNK